MRLHWELQKRSNTKWQQFHIWISRVAAKVSEKFNFWESSENLNLGFSDTNIWEFTFKVDGVKGQYPQIPTCFAAFSLDGL